MGTETFTHNASGYSNHKCRCVSCLIDHAKKVRDYSRTLVTKKDELHEHSWRRHGVRREICRVCRKTRNDAGAPSHRMLRASAKPPE